MVGSRNFRAKAILMMGRRKITVRGTILVANEQHVDRTPAKSVEIRLLARVRGRWLLFEYNGEAVLHQRTGRWR